MKFRFSFSQTVKVRHTLTIYDGSNDESTLIEMLSGNIANFNISSTGNFLFVEFITNKADSLTGFLATIHYGIFEYQIMLLKHCILKVKFNCNALWAFCRTWAFCHLGHYVIQSFDRIRMIRNCFLG